MEPKFFFGKSSPGEGAARIPGAGQSPEVPFHVTVRDSLIYKLVYNSPCVGLTAISHMGTGEVLPCSRNVGHPLCTAQGRRE